MCFSKPKAPNIVYQGISQDQIDQNAASLELYKTQMAQQQQLFSDQLQSQIAAANQQTADLQQKYADEAAAAAAAAGAQQTGAYAATATQSEAPTTAQTTAAVTKKEKPKANLKISSAALPSSSGTGLNIGV